MRYVLILLVIICTAQVWYIVRVRRQAAAWLEGLKEIRREPTRKMFIGGNGLFADINYELNGILRENQKNLLELEKSEAANRRILTDLSHDVRTPLASLTGYLEALAHGSAADAKEYIRVSYDKALSLKTLIDMLFEWCKLYSGAQTYRLERCDLNELTRECAIDWLDTLEKKGIALTVRTADEEWSVMADRVAYKRVIDNLIRNAVEHGKCTSVSVGVRKTDGTVSAVVSNDGEPIPEEKLPFLFDRLYKCDPARSQAGTGLGLAIAKELTVGMRGEIRVRSAAGEGTVFTVLFPATVREK